MAVRRPLVGMTYSSDLHVNSENRTLLGDFFQGVADAGATPLAIDCDDPQGTVRRVVPRLDGLIIGGGGDVDPRRYGAARGDQLVSRVNPVRDGLEEEAIHLSIAYGVPVLAICRGMQFLNVTMGGTLYVDLERDYEGAITHHTNERDLIRTVHDVTLEPGSMLAKWIGRDGVLAVNSQHHQGVRELGRGLSPVAWAPDGLVEAIQTGDGSLVGVQWHPEVLWRSDKDAAALLEGFVAHCGGRHRAGPEL